MWAPTRKPFLTTRPPIRTPSRATHSHYHRFKSTTSKPFKSSLFDSATKPAHSSTTRSYYHHHSVRTSSSTIRSIVVWTTPKSYFFQKRPAVATHKYVHTTEPTKATHKYLHTTEPTKATHRYLHTTEPTKAPGAKTNFLSTLWRKENGRGATTHQSGQTLPVYTGGGIDYDPTKEKRPIKPMNTLSEQAVQPGAGKIFTYFVVGRPNNEVTTGSDEEDDDYSDDF